MTLTPLRTLSLLRHCQSLAKLDVVCVPFHSCVAARYSSRPPDWTLLSSGLEFLYIDPVLRFHLDQQADAILGRRLLDFVHPDEHTSAHQDLGKVLESRTLHGSVTRYVQLRSSTVLRCILTTIDAV